MGKREGVVPSQKASGEEEGGSCGDPVHACGDGEDLQKSQAQEKQEKAAHEVQARAVVEDHPSDFRGLEKTGGQGSEYPVGGESSEVEDQLLPDVGGKRRQQGGFICLA